MAWVGKRFGNGDMFIPEVILCAKVMSSGLVMLEPLLVDTQIPTAGKVVIGIGMSIILIKTWSR